MKPTEPIRPDRPEDVADQNVAKLLSAAYRPEALDASFVERTTQALMDESQRRFVQQRSAYWFWGRRPLRWTAAAALLFVLGAVAGIWSGSLFHEPDPIRNSWTRGSLGRGLPDDLFVPRTASLAHNRPLTDALIAHPRGPSRQWPALATGDQVRTGPRERRRLELADGSFLYLNHDTQLTVLADRKIDLQRGEIYLEVAHQEQLDITEDDASAEHSSFIVKTPDRELVSLGTKFNVRADPTGTRVAVTQGKVRVSGLEQPLFAGQQFAPSRDEATQGSVQAVGQTSHVIDWAQDLVAAVESPLVPASQYAGGALLAKLPDGQETSLSMRRYHVDVHIEDGFARTTIDQTYFNHETFRLEGTFFFPLPPDASLSRLAMYVNGKLMEGGMAEREHARNVFESIVRKQKDPALLEWIDGSTFRMRVFPLEGRQEKRIVLSYTQRLPRRGDRVQYRFPGGHNMPEVDRWSCRIRAKGAADARWQTQAYDFKATKKGRDLVLNAAEEKIRPDRNVVIDLWTADQGAAGGDDSPDVDRAVQFATAEHEGQRYLAVRHRLRPRSEAKSQPRDWVFLFEASADRNPVLARVQIDVVEALLDNAERDDTFVLLAASSRVRSFASKPLPVTPKNVKRAVRFLEQTQLVGALDLEVALQAAATSLEGKQNGCLVHLGSAYPRLGEKEQESLLRQIPEGACYAGVGVGNQWNQTWMKAASGRTGGYFTQINPNEPATWRAIELLSRLNAPRLVDLSVVDDREQFEFLSSADVVCQDEELFAVTRLEGDGALPKFVEITGVLEGEPFSQRLRLRDVERDADYLPRIWAKLQIDHLLAQDAYAHRNEIVKLSMAMYVMSPFTSLLVLENEQMYEEYNVDRGRKDHWALYPCPEKIPVVHEPLASVQPADPSPTDTGRDKPTIEEVLQTIVIRVPSSPRAGQAGGRSKARSYTVWQLAQPRYQYQWGGMQDVWRRSRNRGLGWRNQPTHWYWGIQPADSGVISWDGLVRDPVARNMDGLGVPLLFKTPYVNRLFRGTSMGRQTDSLMMMVTPRIIIREEEELQLGMDFTATAGQVRAVRLQVDNGRVVQSALAKLLGTVSQPSRFDVDLPFLVQAASDGEEYAGYPGGDFFAEPFYPYFAFRDLDAFFYQGLPSQERLGTRVYPVGDFVTSLSFSADGRTLANGVDDSLRIWSVEQRFTDWMEPLAYPEVPPILYPSESVWSKLTMARQKYAAVDLSQLRRPLDQVFESLSKPTSLDFDATPLDEAIARLNEQHGLKIQLDAEQLAAAGVADGATVTLKVDEVPLRVALHRMLRPLKLTFVFQAGRLAIVPLDHAVVGEVIVQDLLAYAPGMSTTLDDVLTVLDAEAKIEPGAEIGQVDRDAARLVNRARKQGWRQLIGQGDGSSNLVFDGSGRFRLEQRTTLGLKEVVLCDGRELFHLYPELGVGSRRTFSRFHRQSLLQQIPWLLPPVEELARLGDVMRVDDSTVLIVPHGSSETSPQDDVKRIALRLVFAADGRLAERQMVVLSGADDAKVVWRETYDVDGWIRLCDADGVEQRSWRVETQQADAPRLRPAESLVVLPMPWRTRDHVLAARSLQDDGVYDGWSTADALAVTAAETAAGTESLPSTVGWRFLATGDHRLGLYTLLLASGVDWHAKRNAENDRPYDVASLFRPLEDHPREPLARYIGAVDGRFASETADKIGRLGGSSSGFLQQIAALHDLWFDWQRLREGPEGRKDRDRLERRSIRFIQRKTSMPFVASLLSAVRQYGDDALFVRVCDATAESLQRPEPLAFGLRFEHAEVVCRSGDPERGLEQFQSLVRDMLNARVVPVINQEVKATFFDGGQRQEAWRQLVEQIVEGAERDLSGTSSLAVAQQLHKLGETEPAERIFASVTTWTGTPSRTSQRLAAVRYLWATEQRARAAAMLEPLLRDERLGQVSAFWRLAAIMAQRRNLPVLAADCLDEALHLEFPRLPEELDLERFRTDYRQLLKSYATAAESLSVSGLEDRQRVVSRIVRAADRWRSLDSDVDEVCRLAADPLAQLGAVDLAWEYLTSPLAGDGEKSIPWLEIGRDFHRQGRYDVAERAYAMAFAAEPKNAVALWSRAQLLLEAGRRDEALPLLQELAEGTWDAEYDTLQQRAERLLRGKE